MQIGDDSFRPRWAAVAFLAIASMSAAGAEPVDPGVGDPYPLTSCVVAEMPLDENAQVISIDGRECRVCCPECADRFLQDSFFWNDKIDKLIIQQQLPHYPLTKCIVDDRALPPDLGLFLDSTNYVFRNRLFRLCSGKCEKALEQAPAKFFGKLDQAVIEKQKSTYPLSHCVVSGKPLDDQSCDYVVANLLVRLASAEDLSQFNRTPWVYVEKIRNAHIQAKQNQRAGSDSR